MIALGLCQTLNVLNMLPFFNCHVFLVLVDMNLISE